MVKKPPANAGDVRDPGLVPGSGRSPGREKGNPLQYSCLENPTDRGAWRATTHGVAQSQAGLKQLSTTPRPEQVPRGLVQMLTPPRLQMTLYRGLDQGWLSGVSGAPRRALEAARQALPCIYTCGSR